MNRVGQAGILLEVFILILILVMFTFFWNGFSRNIFLAGLLLVDDSSVRHSCSNMLPVVVGNNYITNSPAVDSAVATGLLDYLGSSAEPTSIADASFFYSRVSSLFPSMRNNIRITVVSGSGRSSSGLSSTSLIESLSAGQVKSSSCSMPLYSLNDSVTAIVTMDVII